MVPDDGTFGPDPLVDLGQNAQWPPWMLGPATALQFAANVHPTSSPSSWYMKSAKEQDTDGPSWLAGVGQGPNTEHNFLNRQLRIYFSHEFPRS